MRNTSLKISILALVIAASLAIVPAASATSIPITFGGTTVGTATLDTTVGDMCGTFTLAAGDTCVSITMTGGNEIRFGGDTLGLVGTLATGSDVGIDFDSSSTLSIASHPCNANLRSKTNSLCFASPSNGGLNSGTLNLVIDGTITGLVGVHIIGPACGAPTGGTDITDFPTCFASGGTPSVVPEPGTLGLLGTGLVGIAGLVRRRFNK